MDLNTISILLFHLVYFLLLPNLLYSNVYLLDSYYIYFGSYIFHIIVHLRSQIAPVDKWYSWYFRPPRNSSIFSFWNVYSVHNNTGNCLHAGCPRSPPASHCTILANNSLSEYAIFFTSCSILCFFCKNVYIYIFYH